MGKHVTDVGLEQTSSEHEIKKHAAIIHCSNTLSLLQRKITNALLYHAYKELMSREEHEITIKHLCKLISYQGNNHSAIKDALRGLLSTVLEWNVVSDTTGVEDWTASSILASVSLKGPLCYFAYSPRMKQLLHSPSMFGKVNLMVQSRFKSSYGLALYENCIRYRGLPFTKWFDIETFRKLMGVPAGKYLVFRDFKRRVLDKSVEEVNTYSEIIVEPELYREGRQVTKVRFGLKERSKKTRLGSKQSIQLNDEEEIENPLVSLKAKLMEHFSLSVEQVRQVLREYGSDFILEKMTIIESSKNYQRGNVHNLAAYFMSALKNNYQAATGSVSAQNKIKLEEKQKEDELVKFKKLLEQAREQYLAYKENLIDITIQGLSEKQKQIFFGRFGEFAKDSIQMVLKLQRKKYTRETVLESPQIKAMLRQFALSELPNVREQLSSIENFIENLPKKYQNAWEKIQVLEPDHVMLF